MSVLVNPPALILRDQLIVDTAFTDPSDAASWPFYVASMPDGPEGGSVPDNAGTIYDTGGAKDGRQMDGANVWHPLMQVRFRGSPYTTLWALVNTVEIALAAIKNAAITVNSTDYVIISTTQAHPISLGLEKGTKRRFLIVINFQATLKEA